MRAIALGLLLAIGCDKGGPTKEELARQKAEAESEQAVKDAEQAKAKLEQWIKVIDDLDAKIAAAINKVAEAQSDDERAAAQAELKKLREDREALVREAAAARAAKQVLERRQGLPISKECMDNPLAKGCS